MSDRSASTAGIAGRYAAAIFELAEESDKLESVEGHLGALKAAIGESDDFAALIASPIVSREDQGAAMAAICKAMEIGAPVSSLVGLMAAKRRLFALPQVIEAFSALLAKKRGVVAAEVTAATPLTAAQQEELEAVIKKFAGADIALDVTVDEALIGGLVVKVGSKMIDTSIRSRLASLETAMKEVG
ncbi:F0F1 ATP synthase subunit delta [Pikeienuella piscinae]|uniref:ATP synthase subunit delta n=1 Tax=Pikeienuella piscinae TaxID=2748098 RepID=A0A7M3T557_9RHOB|nr:F0F1 ATP synthase subunit delta [Pikeienuella piscinae]QIE57138.1 F0F1 ATP synthase subunit delta [Pikeienuella piscinae]